MFMHYPVYKTTELRHVYIASTRGDSYNDDGDVDLVCFSGNWWTIAAIRSVSVEKGRRKNLDEAVQEDPPSIDRESTPSPL